MTTPPEPTDKSTSSEAVTAAPEPTREPHATQAAAAPEPTDKPLSEQAVTAADLARVIRRFSHVFSTGDMGNLATSDALSDLADFLSGLGSVPVNQIRNDRKSERAARPSFTHINYRTLSLDDVDLMLKDDGISKSSLIQMGRTRFGMPESRLKRLPTAEVIDAIRAAAAHEESLNLIEKNAEASGRARNS